MCGYLRDRLKNAFNGIFENSRFANFQMDTYS